MTEFFEMPIVRGVFRTLASLLIAAAFLVVLMVASAQQQVMLALKETDAPKMSYSSARQLVDSVDDKRQRLRLIYTNISQREARNDKIADQLPALQSQLKNVTTEIIVINDALSKAGLCGLGIVPNEYFPSEVWFGVRGCRNDPGMPPETRKAIERLEDPVTGFIAQKDKIDLLDEERKRNADLIASSRLAIGTIISEIQKASPAVESFRDIEFIDRNAVMRTIGLTSFPPALMQIILTFLSGLFGALLLTIILAVYPSNDFKFTQSHSYWSRILLGGLIAVGVFVVIGGGVTVLGSNQGLFDGEANFMSFCAIGMLAGMFSDRVAQWMSARADMFVDTTRLTEEDAAIAAAAAQAGAEGGAVAPANAVAAVDPADPQARG